MDISLRSLRTQMFFRLSQIRLRSQAIPFGTNLGFDVILMSCKLMSNRVTIRRRHVSCHEMSSRDFVFLAWVHLKPVFPPLNLGLIRISHSPFKKSKNPLLISQNYVWRCFVILGDFWGCLGRDSFSQRISKIWRNKKYFRFNVILKFESEVKN